MQGMIPFAECPVGLFESESGELCVKSEYSLHAIIVSTGEKFWGGAKSMHELCKVKVRPVEVEIVRKGRWVAVPSSDMATGKAYKCSECNKMR